MGTESVLHRARWDMEKFIDLVLVFTHETKILFETSQGIPWCLQLILSTYITMHIIGIKMIVNVETGDHSAEWYKLKNSGFNTQSRELHIIV